MHFVQRSMHADSPGRHKLAASISDHPVATMAVNRVAPAFRRKGIVRKETHPVPNAGTKPANLADDGRIENLQGEREITRKNRGWHDSSLFMHSDAAIFQA
jgi:hypothetical protein